MIRELSGLDGVPPGVIWEGLLDLVIGPGEEDWLLEEVRGGKSFVLEMAVLVTAGSSSHHNSPADLRDLNEEGRRGVLTL